MIKRLLSFSFYPLAIALPLWLIGFGVFLLYVFSFQLEQPASADAIVVWTGGESRIQQGLELLQQQKAPRLFISGVNKSVQPQMFLGDISDEMRAKINLGYLATTTEQNADETADWIYKNGIKSVLLVTSFYHMPRSLVEFRHALPATAVSTHAVWPKDIAESVDWVHTRAAFHLLVEYNKFLIIKTLYLLKGLF